MKTAIFAVAMFLILVGAFANVHHVYKVEGIAQGLCYTNTCVKLGNTVYMIK